MTAALKDAWFSGRQDRLGAKGEALAWALRQAWPAQGNDAYGLLKFVSGNVQKPDGSHPWPEALSALFSRIDNDDEWYPGKISDAGGRPRTLSGTNANTTSTTFTAPRISKNIVVGFDPV